MHQNTGRAVGRQRVVIARSVAQIIDRLYVIEKDPADVLERRARPVDIDVLLGLAIGRPHADHIALVGDDVVQFILPKKTGDRRIALAFLFARLDRHREVILAREAKAYHHMGDRFARPVHGDNIRGIELTQVVGAIFPTGVEIGFAAIVKLRTL